MVATVLGITGQRVLRLVALERAFDNVGVPTQPPRVADWTAADWDQVMKLKRVR